MQRVVNGSTFVGKGVKRAIRLTDLEDSGSPYNRYVRLDILNTRGNIISTMCCRKDVLKQSVNDLAIR